MADLPTFDAGGVGVLDDIVGAGSAMRIEFRSHRQPCDSGLDSRGTVIATRFGRGPVYVLAEDEQLREAWNTIRAQWPTRISGVLSALRDIRQYGGR